MLIAEVIKAIESIAPPHLQAGWDNTGLQTGDRSATCTGVLLAVDVNTDVIAEAVRRGCNLVVSHHPLIFKGLKSLTGDSPVQRAVAAAIRADIAVYSSHTSLDSAEGGISYTMTSMLGATPVEALDPADEKQERVSVTVPPDMADHVRMLIFDLGTQPEPGSDAVLSRYDISASTLHSALPEGDGFGDIPESITINRPMTSIEAVMSRQNRRRLTDILADSPDGHRISIESTALAPAAHARQGLGVYALMNEPMTMRAFLDHVKATFGCGCIRHSALPDPDATVRRIACCGGSGGEFIPAAIGFGAQVYVSADIRYHDFGTYADDIVVVDAGHYETENCAKDIFYHVLTKKFPNFAVYYSETDKNPVKYL